MPNAQNTSASLNRVSLTDSEDSDTPEKKTLGYKQRCPKKRHAYQQQRATAEAAGKTLVYLDETGFQQEAFRSHGYAIRGQAVHGLITSQRTRTQTLIAAQFNNQVIAPKLLSGSCNAQKFNEWLSQELCPHLNSTHVVIMDNAPIHKTDATRTLIEACGAAVLYLPPYSPDYNPVEHLFANMKRCRAYHADTPIEQIINMFT